MAVDFSKIFSQNSPSTPFTWTDAEYLQGWDVIQNTPPTRQQFNALQKISDEKDLELYNTKAPKHSPVFTGDPQAPTPAWNDNDASLATTAFVQHWIDVLQNGLRDNGVGITASSFGRNGYVRFKNGFIIQWAIVATDSTGVAAGVFPITFPNGCRGAYASGDEASTSDWHKIIQAAPLSNSVFEVTVYDVITGTKIPNDVSWVLAIGY